SSQGGGCGVGEGWRGGPRAPPGGGPGGGGRPPPTGLSSARRSARREKRSSCGGAVRHRRRCRAARSITSDGRRVRGGGFPCCARTSPNRGNGGSGPAAPHSRGRGPGVGCTVDALAPDDGGVCA